MGVQSGRSARPRSAAAMPAGLFRRIIARTSATSSGCRSAVFGENEPRQHRVEQPPAGPCVKTCSASLRRPGRRLGRVGRRPRVAQNQRLQLRRGTSERTARRHSRPSRGRKRRRAGRQKPHATDRADRRRTPPSSACRCVAPAVMLLSPKPRKSGAMTRWLCPKASIWLLPHRMAQGKPCTNRIGVPLPCAKTPIVPLRTEMCCMTHPCVVLRPAVDRFVAHGKGIVRATGSVPTAWRVRPHATLCSFFLPIRFAPIHRGRRYDNDRRRAAITNEAPPVVIPS